MAKNKVSTDGKKLLAPKDKKEEKKGNGKAKTKAKAEAKPKAEKEPKEKKRTIRMALTEFTAGLKHTDDEIIAKVLKEFPEAKLSRADVHNNRMALNRGEREALGFPVPKKAYERMYKVGSELVAESKAPEDAKRRPRGEGSVRENKKAKTKSKLAEYGVNAKTKTKKNGKPELTAEDKQTLKETADRQASDKAARAEKKTGKTAKEAKE